MFGGGVVEMVWMLCVLLLELLIAWMSGLPDSEVKNEWSLLTVSSLLVSAAPYKGCLDNCFHCLRKSPSDAPMGSWHFQFINVNISECMYSAENASASKKGVKKAYTSKALLSKGTDCYCSAPSCCSTGTNSIAGIWLLQQSCLVLDLALF